MPLTKAFDLEGDNSKSQKDLVWDGKFVYSFQTEKAATGNKVFRIETLGCCADWTLQVSGTVANLHAAAYSGTITVVVGDSTILTSTDGATWVPQGVPFAVNLFSVVWNGTAFIAVGDNGIVLRSFNGTTWSIMVGPSGLPTLFNVIWDGTQFIAVGEVGYFQTSPTGAVWTPLNVGVIEPLHGIAFSGSRYVAVGDSGRVLTSQNLTDWSSVPAFTTVNLKGILWDGKNFLCVGEGGFLFSSLDGNAWQSQDLNCDPLSISFNGHLLLITGQVAGLGFPLIASTNRKDWFTVNSNSADDLNGSVWIGDRFLAVGNTGTISLSEPLITPCGGTVWAPVSMNPPPFLPAIPPHVLNAISSNDSIVVAVGSSGRVVSSSDGFTWHVETSGTIANLNGICWDGEYFIAVGDTGTIVISPDGHNWSSATSAGIDTLQSVTSNGFLAVAVGGVGGAVVYVSTNRTLWTASPSPAGQPLNSVCWDGHKYVAVGNTGTILTSQDASTWRTEVSGTASNLLSVFYSGSQYVAVGIAGIILLSQDAVVWIPQISGVMEDLHAVIWHGFEWLAVGTNGTALESSDGTNWIPATTGAMDDLLGVTFFVNAFFSALDTGNGVSLTPTSGTVNFIQTFSGTDSTNYSVEVILRSEQYGNPAIFLYDDNAGKVVGFLNTLSGSKYFQRFSGTLTSGTGVTTLTLYVITPQHSGLTTTGFHLVDITVEVSSASVQDITNPFFPVEKLVNGDFKGDVNPFNNLPDGWGISGIYNSATLIAEETETILNIYKHLVLGGSAEVEQNGLFWYKIALATNRLSHIILGGASFLNCPRFGPVIAFLISYHDETITVPKTELVLVDVNSKKSRRFLLAYEERDAIQIGAITLFLSGNEERLALLEGDRFLRIYSFPEAPTDPMQFVKTTTLAVDDFPVRFNPKGMTWAPFLNSFAILTQQIAIPLDPAPPPFVLGDWIFFVRVDTSNFLTSDTQLPESGNLGLTYFNGRILLSNPVPPSSPGLLGYVVNNVVTAYQITESWAPAETVAADGVSEITLTLTIVNQLFGVVGPGVTVLFRGFKNSSTLFRPQDFFDGQAMQDIARFKPTSATSQDLGNVSNINDDSLATRWASSTFPASATIDLQFDYTLDLVYYNADIAQQKYAIELLNSVNATLYTIDNTAAFSNPKALFDLDPAIETVRKIKLTVNDSDTGEAQCNVLSAFSGSTQLLNGIFYLPGGRGVTLKDTSVHPFYLIGRTNESGQIVVKYRSGLKGGFSVEQLEYQLLT